MSSFWLEYTQDGQRREFSFDSGSVTVGRDKSADFVLDHPTVSRQHALIREDQGRHKLVVLSRGGLTAIDGGQVEGEVPLFDGSEIHFGQLSFTFRSNTAPPKPAAAGAPAPASNFAAPSSNFGAQPIPAAASSGSWGDADWSAPAAPEPAPEKPRQTGGIVTWDQIANSAEAQDDYLDEGVTDFQRIQAAQAKADAQTRGNNKWILYGGVLGILAMIAITVWPASKKPIEVNVDPTDINKPFIAWEKTDIDCVGRANCRAEAIAAYKVGKNLVEQAGADITNPYESYKQFDRAQRLLDQGGITPVPDEMADVLTLQTAVKAKLEAKFNQARVNYLNFQKRKMYKNMADELNRVQAYFPDKRCLYNQWAVAKEREMKDNQVYPAVTLY